MYTIKNGKSVYTKAGDNMREIAFSNKINKWIIQEPSSAPYKYYTYLRVNSYIQYVIIIYYVGCVGYVIKLKKKKTC